MNKHLKYIQKNMRALSPVVASIILIAVTVAVSVAVAAWMGGMTIGFMGTSSMTITAVDFVDNGTNPNTITLTMKNTGTKTITIASVKVNNVPVGIDPETLSVPAGTGNVTLKLFDSAADLWVNGNTYKIDLFDTNNQVVGSTQQNAPGA
jgi:flagellin-like protein